MTTNLYVAHYRPDLIDSDFDYSFFLVKEKGKRSSIVCTAPEGFMARVVNELDGIDPGMDS
jgi:hypothetical protein